MVKEIDNLQALSYEDALTFAYQLLGAVNYFLISPATLSGIFADNLLKISAGFSSELNLLIDSRVNWHSTKNTAKMK